MNASFTKRFGAFLIDILIILFISSLITGLLPQNKDIPKLQKELTDYTKITDLNNFNLDKYISSSADIRYSLDNALIPYTIIIMLIYIGYYVVFAFFRESKTVGRSLFKIKVVKEDGNHIKINDLLIRTLIVEGLFVTIINLTLIFILKPYSYFLITYLTELIYIISLIIIGFMVLYRKDKKALHDIITKTYVKEG